MQSGEEVGNHQNQKNRGPESMEEEEKKNKAALEEIAKQRGQVQQKSMDRIMAAHDRSKEAAKEIGFGSSHSNPKPKTNYVLEWFVSGVGPSSPPNIDLSYVLGLESQAKELREELKNERKEKQELEEWNRYLKGKLSEYKEKYNKYKGGNSREKR